MPPVKYLGYIKMYNSVCITYVNDIKAYVNDDIKGPLSLGLNFTPYLENGKNSISIEVASLTAIEGKSDFPADARCELRVTAATPDGETEIAKVVSTVNDKKQPTGKTSPDYQGTNGHTPVTEAQVKDSLLYRIKREFTAEGIPHWVWTQATPFQPTKENMAKLKQAYLNMAQLFINKDSAGIQKVTQIAFSENELAEGMKAGSWYASMEFEKDLPKIASIRPINWEEYELLNLNNGRLIKLDHRGRSPLRFVDKNGQYLFAYNPDFSLINGQIILTR